MKKIYRFLSLFCLLLMTGGTALAQDSDTKWDVDGDNPVTVIEPGTNYALRHGTNAGFEPNEFLSVNGSGITEPDVYAIYQFEVDGQVTTDGETLPLACPRRARNRVCPMKITSRRLSDRLRCTGR